MTDQIKFNMAELEQLLWKALLNILQQALIEILSTLDIYLMAKEDKNRYEYKEKKENWC
ncbi:MAG: hypothetical protein WAP05_03815 [Dethiobacteria bacterium]